MTTQKNRRLLMGSAIAVLLILGALLVMPMLFTGMGRFLVVDTIPKKTDAAVVLSTGVDYYPRLMQAALLYKSKLVDSVVINGNRKTDALRELEAMGFKMPYPWFEQAKRILAILGVPRKHVIAISAEDAYDTVSEAQMVGDALPALGIKRITITTSKFHTRRALRIWRDLHGNRFDVIQAASAAKDPFDPATWWKSGRQARWVLAEYGAWLYYFWKY